MKPRISVCLAQGVPVFFFVSLAIGGQAVESENARFARDLYASRASVLIIGDSTNNPEGAGSFVPYYEGLIQTLPAEIEICGFRTSGSTGNTGVNGYVGFVGGTTSQMVGNHIAQLTPDIPVGSTDYAPPGIRNEFTLLPDGRLFSFSRFAAVGYVNLAGILPRADAWAQDSTLVIRTPFYTAPGGTMIERISVVPLIDRDGSAGDRVYNFEQGVQADATIDQSALGMQHLDVVFEQPQTSRIGVMFAGDLDNDDADEAGRSMSWCGHLLFKQELADADHGFYLDSVSVGGFTAGDHVQNLSPEILDDYFAQAPRAFNTVLIWLGQNSELDEWNGSLQPAWGERIEAIGDRAIEASLGSGAPQAPRVVLCTPPLLEGTYPSPRFSAMNQALGEIAARRGWGHIDLQTLVGASMVSLDPGYQGAGVHPSQSGSVFVDQLLYQQLACIRAEFTGDDTRDFFDVSAYLQLFNQQDPQADFNGDGIINFFDISAFIQAYGTPCP